MAESLRNEPGIRESIIDKICELISGDPDAAKGQKGGLRVNEHKRYIENLDDINGITVEDDISIFVRTSPDNDAEFSSAKNNDLLIISNTSGRFDRNTSGDVLKYKDTNWIKEENIIDFAGINKVDFRGISYSNGFAKITELSNFTLDDLDNPQIPLKKEQIYSGIGDKNIAIVCNNIEGKIDSRIFRGSNDFEIKKGDIFISRTATLENGEEENRWEHYHPGYPPPDFQYRCGLKSVSTDPIDPRNIQNPIRDVPALYFGYGGVRRFTDIDIADQDPRFLNERAVDEEFERLVILLYIIYDKFKNDKNVITTSARIHDMIGMFVDKLRQSPPELGEIANIEDARLAFVSPSSASPDGIGNRRELLFAIEIDYTYLMGH